MVDAQALDDLQAQPEQIIRQLFSKQWREYLDTCLDEERLRLLRGSMASHEAEMVNNRAAMEDVIRRVKDLAGMPQYELVHDYLQDL